MKLSERAKYLIQAAVGDAEVKNEIVALISTLENLSTPIQEQLTIGEEKLLSTSAIINLLSSQISRLNTIEGLETLSLQQLDEILTSMGVACDCFETTLENLKYPELSIFMDQDLSTLTSLGMSEMDIDNLIQAFNSQGNSIDSHTSIAEMKQIFEQMGRSN